MKRYIILLFVLVLLINIYQIINGQSLLEKVMVFKGENAGYASFNSKDGSLLINHSSKGNKEIYWYKDNKIIKRIPNVTLGLVSPSGDYYSYYNKTENILYIFKENSQLMNKFIIKNFNDSTWSYDSKYIYWCEYGKKDYIVHRINIFTGVNEHLLDSKRIYISPIATNDNDVLFLLESIHPKESDSDYNIVKYDLIKKKIEKVILPPIKDLFIFDSYTISPNGKIVVFEDANSGYVYIVDLVKVKIIDKITLPSNSSPGYYSWKNDSSYFIFNVTGQEIDKYIIPKY